jgi:hypothetical protein
MMRGYTKSSGLDPDQLERLLCQTLLQRTKYAEHVVFVAVFEGLGARCHLQGLEGCSSKRKSTTASRLSCYCRVAEEAR